MEFLRELFVTAFLAVAFSFIVAISIAMAGGTEKNDDNNKEKKMTVEEVKFDKKLKVKGGKSKKRVKFADDVVVKHVDHFEVAEEPNKDFELSEKVGFLDKLSEGVIMSGESEEAKTTKVDDQFGGGGVVKESEVMPCSEELVKECDKVNNSMEVKGDDDEEKGCKDFGVLDKLLESQVVGQKTETSKAGEFHGVEGKIEVVGDLEDLDIGDRMMPEEIGGNSALEFLKGGVRINQNGDDEAKDSHNSASKLFDEALEGEAVKKISKRPEVNLEKSCVGDCLEDVIVDKKLKGEVSGSQNEVEIAKDDCAVCQNEESDPVGVGVSGAVESEGGGLGKGDEAKGGLVREKNIDDGQNEEGNRAGVGESGAIDVKEEGLGKENEVKEGLARDKNIDDDWEGVESSELEKVFAEAVNYVEYGGKGRDDKLANLGSDMQMQLYGLQRVALEGPCHEPQPMALKVSARAKWNAWQRLGSMSPEVAMEQYIKLLSDADPGWIQPPSAADGKHELVGTEATGGPEATRSFDIQAETEDERLKNEKA